MSHAGNPAALDATEVVRLAVDAARRAIDASEAGLLAKRPRAAEDRLGAVRRCEGAAQGVQGDGARQLCQGALLRGPPAARPSRSHPRARLPQIFGKHPILWLLPTNQGIEGNGIFYELSVESQAGPGEKLW